MKANNDIVIRPIQGSDWQDITRIYQADMDMNLATFQTDCPSYEEWNTSHIAECRFVAEQSGKVLGWAAFSPVSSRCVYAGGWALVEVPVMPALPRIANKTKRWFPQEVEK